MALFDNLPDEVNLEEEETQEEQTTELPDEVNLDEATEDNDTEETAEAEESEQAEEPEVETTESSEESVQEPNDSSLTSEPQTQPEQSLEDTTEPEPVSEDLIFSTLSEKLGKEIKSWEDLQAPEQDDLDPELKQINEWKKKTNRPIEDWYKYQKDYSTMNEEEVVREHLRHTYPDFTEEEIALEMEEYVSDDMDSDRDIARKNLKLKKQATSARRELNEYKSTFETPIEPNVPQEYKQAMEFYSQYQDSNAKTQETVKAYQQGIDSTVGKVKSIPLNLSEETSINLNLSEEDSRELPKLIKETPHWFNQDGSYNYESIVKDAVKMRHFDKAVKAAYEQGKNEGREQEDTDSRNVDFSKARNTNTSGGGDDIIIEGADEMLNGGRLMFGNR